MPAARAASWSVRIVLRRDAVGYFGLGAAESWYVTLCPFVLGVADLRHVALGPSYVALPILYI